MSNVVNKYKESYDVYIGRGSKWGNPFTVEQYGRDECINKYKEYILSNPELLADLHELEGKTLGCFCKPKACHGDVLVELLNNLNQENKDTSMFKEYTPMQYLAIDIGNQYGLDKEVFEKRIEWVKSNLNDLEAYTEEAEEPLLYAKAVKALRDTQAGKPTGHTVALDAVCSGLSLMSTVMRCEKGANITGLINPNKRSDAYTEVTKYMNKLLKEDGIDSFTVSRKDAKSAVMTLEYEGSII